MDQEVWLRMGGGLSQKAETTFVSHILSLLLEFSGSKPKDSNPDQLGSAIHLQQTTEEVNNSAKQKMEIYSTWLLGIGSKRLV